MAGGYYIALSGMRARLDALDRLASDIANANTPGYKTERGATVEADRPSFNATLQSAIDVTMGPTRVDLRSGGIASTGRDLDVALDGPGFLQIETSAGTRYTRNGRLMRRADGVLATADGDLVVGDAGKIAVGTGNIQVDPDGTVRHDGTVAGKMKVVTFDPDAAIAKESAFRLRSDGATPKPLEQPSIRSGALEQSNVSVVERVAELTTVTRNFESLQKAISIMSDIETRSISELSRR